MKNLDSSSSSVLIGSFCMNNFILMQSCKIPGKMLGDLSVFWPLAFFMSTFADLLLIL